MGPTFSEIKNSRSCTISLEKLLRNGRPAILLIWILGREVSSFGVG